METRDIIQFSMDLLNQYYTANYSLHCNQEPSYFATPEFFTNACHIGTIFMIIFSSYALFLMIKVSPPAMRSFVPYMIHLHIWTMLCDFVFSVVVCPYYFLPLLAGVPLGLLSKFKVSFIVQMWPAFAALGGMCCAIVTMFEQRHKAIVSSSCRFVMRRKSTRIIFNVIFYGYHINFGLPEILTVPENQEELKLQFLQTIPCPPAIYFDTSMAIIQKDGSLFNPHMYFTCFYFTCLMLFYVFHTLWTLSNTNNPNMSNATRRLQRNFFLSSFIQVTIPICVLLAPNIYWNLSITFRFYSQVGNNMSVICFTLHGLSASIATMVLYKPYREYTYNLLLNRILRLTSKVLSGTSRVVTVIGHQT